MLNRSRTSSLRADQPNAVAGRCCRIAGIPTHPGRPLRGGPEKKAPCHHPYPETLLSYAAGTLPGTAAYVVWCHLSVCRDCAAQIRRLEMVGGILLDRLDASSTGYAHAVESDRNWANSRKFTEHRSKPGTRPDEASLPLPLANPLGCKLAVIPWTLVENDLWEYSDEYGVYQLLRLKPGQYLRDQCSASGTSLTLVLEGVFRDGAETYTLGDIIEWEDDPSRRLKVIGDKQGICLSATPIPES